MPFLKPPRVLVTRSAQQASALAERLRDFDMEPIVVPGIEFVEPTSFAPLDEALTQLAKFDWLIFTSANAVRFLLQRAPQSVQTCAGKIAVIGEATAVALREAGRAADLVAPQAVAESLTQALLPRARTAAGLPTRFLLLRAEEGREHLPESLRAAGAEVIVAPVYRTVMPESSVPLIAELFGDRERLPDAATFTSSSTVHNLLALCVAANVRLPATMLRVSIGPVTSRTLQEQGWPPHAEAPEASVVSLAQTVAQALQGR